MTKKRKSSLSINKYEYIPMDDYTNYYRTFDLHCAAALASKDFELVSIDKENPNKVQFIFRREPYLDTVVDDYWADRLEVKARTFADNIKMLKNRIYSE